MNRNNESQSRRHRLTPVWRADLDREGFARALLLLAMHLDEKNKTAHKKQQNPSAYGPDGKRGGGVDGNT